MGRHRKDIEPYSRRVAVVAAVLVAVATYLLVRSKRFRR
ncbi:hypothetical protein DFR70_101756 [Nocardia tenerifensis]|uniref:Uncharacterized protein n=1 Tax=Nocardia tenerifensis TaxID=228006 RepID=A0A318KZP5_9NOCA|nr:hypothetical protein DFR70_101756 [Nocardia tenerifensis]